MAATAPASLPHIAGAFSSGLLGIDKVVELTRFATPETDEGLVAWASERSSGAIRHRGELERHRERTEVASAERERSLRWWYEDDRTRFGLEAMLPADQGAIVARALSRLAERVPEAPGDTEQADPNHIDPIEARRADALMMVCSGAISADPDPDRSTLVVHVAAETLVSEPDLPGFPTPRWSTAR